MFRRFSSPVIRDFVRKAVQTAPKINRDYPKWKASHDSLANVVLSDLIFKPNFISEAEETSLVTELDAYLSRHRYEEKHWDYAITHYRETERKLWRAANRPVIERLKQFTANSLTVPAADQSPSGVDDIVLPLIHVLDLAENGEIKPHVDSVRFCGDSIAVISLLSDSVLRMAVAPPEEVVGIPDTHRDLLQLNLPPSLSYVDIHIPRRSIYVMRGASRYLMTHAILANAEVTRLHTVNPIPVYEVTRSRRISVICRTKAAVNLLRPPSAPEGVPSLG